MPREDADWAAANASVLACLNSYYDGDMCPVSESDEAIRLFERVLSFAVSEGMMTVKGSGTQPYVSIDYTAVRKILNKMSEDFDEVEG